MQKYVILKNGVFLKGATHVRAGSFRYTWTSEVQEAMHFEGDDPSLDGFERLVDGKIVAATRPDQSPKQAGA